MMETYRLEEVLENYDYLRKPLSSMEREEFQGEYPYYGAQGIIDHVQEYRCDGEYMLIAEDGENLVSRSQPIAFVVDGKFWVNNHAHIVRTNRKVNIRFLCYMLNNSDIMGYITGAAQPKLSQRSLNKIKMPFPDIKEQEKVVGVLYQYDKAIENNNKRIKILEQMAENMYKEWFVRFRFPGYENVEIEDGKPINWEILRLEDFGIILESGSRPSGGIDDAIEDGVPSLGAEAVNGLAEFDYSSVKLVPYEFYEKLKRGKNKGNHILVYKDGAYIGKVTIFRNEFPYKRYAINEHVFFLNSVDTDYQNYLYFTLHQDAYFTTMQNLNRNAAQPGLSKPDMNRIKISVPDKKTVLAFNEFVEPVFDEVFKLAKSNKILIKQRDLLLPRLMSGKLEVK